jgi:hypothetical protein
MVINTNGIIILVVMVVVVGIFIAITPIICGRKNRQAQGSGKVPADTSKKKSDSART